MNEYRMWSKILCISKSKVRCFLWEKLYSRIQRYSQHSKTLVNITSPQRHSDCQSVYFIHTQTYRNRYRRNQCQCCETTSRQFAEFYDRFWNVNVPGASSTSWRDGNHLVRGHRCIWIFQYLPSETPMQQAVLMWLHKL